MKTRLSVIVALLICASSSLLGQSPSEGSASIEALFLVPSDPEKPTVVDAWKPNKGQLTDTDGLLVPQVQYYSEGSKISTFITNENFSLLWSKVDFDTLTSDSAHRVDVQLSGSSFGDAFIAQEPISGFDNFFLGHIPAGVTDVKSYNRIIVPDVYPLTDFHFYSNNRGLKLYFVLKSGADLALPGLNFSFASEVLETISGGLLIRTTLGELEFRKAIVFEVNSSGNRVVYPNSGRLFERLPGEFGIEIEPILEGKTIFVQIDQGPEYSNSAVSIVPEWSTFYGGQNPEACVDMDVDEDGNLYAAGEVFGTVFPVAGVTIFPMLGGYDLFLGKFSPNYERLWMITYGGSGRDKTGGVSCDGVNGRILVCGETEITSSPMTQAIISTLSFQESYPLGTYCGYIACFDKISGGRVYVSQLGGRTSVSAAVGADLQGNMYVAGATFEQTIVSSLSPTGGPFPVGGPSGAYIQTVNNSSLSGPDADGFIMKFNPQGELTWSTLIGGNGNDALFDLGIDAFYQYLYVVGGSKSTNSGISGCPSPSTYLPFCQAPSSGYFQGDVNGNNIQTISNGDGIIARFTLDGALTWSTFYGGPLTDAITGIAVVNSPPGISPSNLQGTFFISGFTNSSGYGTNCSQTFTGGFPGCTDGISYSQPYGGGANDAFIAEFDLNTTLRWSTFLGGSGTDGTHYSSFCPGPRIDANGGREVYITGTTNSTNLTTNPNPIFYEQFQHGDFSSSGGLRDGFVYGFDPFRTMTYGSYFGGIGNDYSQAIALDWGKVFIGGITQSTANFPLYNPNPGTSYFRSYPVLGGFDANFAQIQVGIPLSQSENLIDIPLPFSLFPNPVSDQLNIEWLSSEFCRSTITIRNFSGQLISSFDRDFSVYSPSHSIPVAQLPKGMYIVNIQADGFQYSAKFQVL